MVSIVFDLIDGDVIHESDGSITARRHALVYGLGNMAGHRKYYQAMRASGMPRRGDKHPTIPNCKVHEVRARAETATTSNHFRIELRYSTRPVPAAGGGLSLSDPDDIDVQLVPYEFVESVDAYGNPFETQYRDAYSVSRDVHRVKVERSSAIVRITRTVRQSVFQLNDLYKNTTNIDRWGPYNPYVIRCEGFQGYTDGKLWRATGSFLESSSKRGDWLQEVRTTVLWWTQRDPSAVVGIGSSGGPAPRMHNGIELYPIYRPVSLRRSGFEPPRR